MPPSSARAITGDLYEGLQLAVVDDEVYGAIDLDPALLTIQCLFADAAALAEAQANGICAIIEEHIVAALQREGYPKKGIAGLSIGFASQEDVDEAGGSWRYFR